MQNPACRCTTINSGFNPGLLRFTCADEFVVRHPLPQIIMLVLQPAKHTIQGGALAGYAG